MTHTPRAFVRALLAVGLAGALLSTGAGGAPSASAGTDSRPQVGDCHDLTLAEAPQVADPDAPVSCDGRFTSRTFLVPAVPDGVAMDDNEALSRIVVRRCRPAWQKAVSPDTTRRLMSAYSGYYWFTPTKAQIEDGARWLRCDLALLGGPRAFAPLPTDIKKPALRPGQIPDDEARCWVGSKSYYVTVCTKAHSLRNTKVVEVAGKAYPSRRAFARVANRQCSAASRTDRWKYFPPTKEGWKAGFRYLQCADVTRD